MAPKKKAAKKKAAKRKNPRGVVRFRAVFEQCEGWVIGTSPDVPGAVSQERTLARARRNLAIAVADILDLTPKLRKKLEARDPELLHETVTVKM